MNTYELAILFDPDLEVDLEKATAKVEKLVTDNGGSITNVDNWGKRKLTYTIKKHDMAVYVFYTADIPAESVRKIESILNITDEVIRFMVTRVDHKMLAKAEAARALKAEQAAKRGDHEDKEDEE